MGKADKRQAKLSFSGGEKRGATSEPRPGDADTEEGSSEISVRGMFMELKTSLAGIDAKLDHVTERLDRIRARVDDHDARFETLETRTSDIEDARSGDREQIAQMERLMEGLKCAVTVTPAGRLLCPRPAFKDGGRCRRKFRGGETDVGHEEAYASPW
ncbi:hypothetical protein NDU88_012829 [Pleurodeles waltl]|uniref:Uncharacterized protein n=1 Tax=Pleurodeles waltl TaxID=8319 RepID=A0AAV7R1C4_PLEWA|nr:hypothetical protein NDU88_012829 [Pleurodeles waltl]